MIPSAPTFPNLVEQPGVCLSLVVDLVLVNLALDLADLVWAFLAVAFRRLETLAVNRVWAILAFVRLHLLLLLADLVWEALDLAHLHRVALFDPD